MFAAGQLQGDLQGVRVQVVKVLAEEQEDLEDQDE